MVAKPGVTGVQRVVDAAGYSLKGLQAAWRSEAAFRQELGLVVVMLPLVPVVGSSVVEYLLLSASLLLVLIVELLNSGIEAVVDRISDEHHELSGRAKDLGSAAVMISLLLLVLVWGVIGYSTLFS